MSWGYVQGFEDGHGVVPSLEEVPLRCAASKWSGDSPYMRFMRTFGMAQWSVCPQEEGIMALVAQPLIPGWRTLAPLSGTHSLHGMRKAFLETMAHGLGRNACGRFGMLAKYMLAKSGVIHGQSPLRLRIRSVCGIFGIWVYGCRV